MSGNRVAVSLTGRTQRQAPRVYGEVLGWLADKPRSEEEREALAHILDLLNRRRGAHK